MTTGDRNGQLNLLKLQDWIGKTAIDSDVADVRHANLMAATINLEKRFSAHDPMPALWHWLYFPEGLPASQLGVEGHTARGGFLPPVPLPNRLWAGGRFEFDGEVSLGATMEKRSELIRIEHKHGATGDLVFVTVLHEIFSGGKRRIREEHDIVYKNPSDPAKGIPAPLDDNVAAANARWTPDIVQLFRYSALTFNSNRVHYDVEYCRETEGYDSVVIHGPLSATMLAAFASRVAGRPLRSFDYRARKLALLGDTLKFGSKVDGRLVHVWTQLPDGNIGMEATARW